MRVRAALVLVFLTTLVVGCAGPVPVVLDQRAELQRAIEVYEAARVSLNNREIEVSQRLEQERKEMLAHILQLATKDERLPSPGNNAYAAELEAQRRQLDLQREDLLRREKELGALINDLLESNPPGAGPGSTRGLRLSNSPVSPYYLLGTPPTQNYPYPPTGGSRPQKPEIVRPLTERATSNGREDSSSRVAELSRNIEELQRLAETQKLASIPEAAAAAAAAASVNSALHIGKMAWNTPPKMAMKETANVELRLTRELARMADLERRITAPGKTTAQEAMFAKKLFAALHSTAFEIAPAGPTEQQYIEGQDAVWQWVISPKLKGKHQLVLTVASAVDGGQLMTPLVRIIEVTAGEDETEDAILAFLTSNWKEILTVILIPIGAGVWRIYKRRSSPT